jgi:hypothetical protein
LMTIDLALPFYYRYGLHYDRSEFVGITHQIYKYKNPTTPYLYKEVAKMISFARGADPAFAQSIVAANYGYAYYTHWAPIRHTITLPVGVYYIRRVMLFEDGNVEFSWVEFNVGGYNKYWCTTLPAKYETASLIDDPSINDDSPLLIVPVVSSQNNGDLLPQPPSEIFVPITVKGSSLGSPVPTQPIPTPTISPNPFPISNLPSTVNGITDPGFESGPNGVWDEYSSNGYAIVMPGREGYWPRSGKWLAWLGGAHNEISSISQTFSVPTTHPLLTFFAISTSEENNCYYDRAKFLVNEYIIGYIDFCKSKNFYPWEKYIIDMRAFAGETVKFSIQMENDASLHSSFFLDDFTFEAGLPPTSEAPAPTPTSTPVSAGIPIRNPGFESGDNGDWITFSQKGYDTIYTGSGAHSGNWFAWLGGAHDEVGSIKQTLYVPVDKPYLTYWGWITSEEVACDKDTVSILMGGVTVHSYGLCSLTKTSGWGQGWVDLRNFGGHAYSLEVKISTSGTLLSNLYLDDFAFSSSPPGSDSNLNSSNEQGHGVPIQTSGQNYEKPFTGLPDSLEKSR